MIPKLFFSGFVLLTILSFGSSTKEESIVSLRKQTCTKTINQICFSQRDCCDNLVCSSFNRTCQCPFGYTWSKEFSRCYRCREGWTFFKDNCYLFSNATATWNQAFANCTALGARLISFSSEVIIDRIREFYDYFKLNYITFTSARSHIVPGNWSWPEGTFIPASGPWWANCFEATNEGGNAISLNRGCSDTDGEALMDIACEDTANPRRYICENRFSALLPGQTNNRRKICQFNNQWSEKLQCCIRCPRGWTVVNDGCFYVSYFTRTWTEANDYCRANRATLFVTNSSVIIDSLAPLFRLKKIESDSYWIGASKVNGKFTWLNGNVLPSTGQMWSECCDPSSTANSNCVATFGYGLENLPCNNQMKFICRYN